MPKAPDPPPSAALETLLSSCLAALESGDPDALDDTCRRHPELAQPLRKAMSRLQASGMLRPPLPDTPDQLGPFRLEARVGFGGMGVVFQAYDTRNQRPVALKLIRPENLHRAQTRARFRREMRSLIQLRHPGIVRALACGEEQGIPYLAMEWLQGQRLDRLASAELERRQSRRANQRAWEQRCIELMLQAADAVRHAHTLGIVHRDIKPGNMLVLPGDRLKLFDFGLAHLQDAECLTSDDAVLGSPRFMAPEQAQGATATPAADIYSLGASLQSLAQLGSDQPLSRGLARVCRRATRSKPRRRHATVSAFIQDLQRLAE